MKKCSSGPELHFFCLLVGLIGWRLAYIFGVNQPFSGLKPRASGPLDKVDHWLIHFRRKSIKSL